MAYRTFNSPDEAAEYVASLDARWPERARLQTLVSEQVALLDNPGRARGPLFVAELAMGAGSLAARLLADHPHLHYTGFDISPMLLALARERLAVYSHRATLLQQDLNRQEWLGRLPRPLAALVSFQSLHDLGDAETVAQMYRLARRQLTPGGRLIVADLLAPDPPDPAASPGRLPVARHLELLAAAGFQHARCHVELGPFGFFTATAPD
ncbi:MAG TPA: class I SAM-dependent methyltransferase [Caldilineaceae bacterium]|nr:class I SAM-dependent methyltransferase [Caldilineaceae bacterium]